MSNNSNEISSFKYTVYIILIIIIILGGLNINKFRSREDEVVSAWSSQEESYYSEKEDRSLITRVKQYIRPDNIIYHLTRVRLKIPITYLKREIPLLGYYTPEELKKPTRTIYQSSNTKSSTEARSDNNRLVRLKFDLRQSDADKDERRIVKRETTNIQKDRPLIAIYHTHTSETYIDDPRKQDDNGHVLPGNIGNVAKAGMALADSLSHKYNFKVIHTTEVHDKSYVRSYYNSRKTVKNLLNKYQDLDMIFDIHRDGIKEGSKEAYTAMVNGEKLARVMIVVTNGKFDFAHLNLKEHHLEWERNLNFARKLASRMEEMYPGLLKKVEIRDTTYNLDLHPQALLLEIGDFQNTTTEAVRSARLVADVIASMALSEN